MNNLTIWLMKRTTDFLKEVHPAFIREIEREPFVCFLGIAKGTGRELSLREFMAYWRDS